MPINVAAFTAVLSSQNKKETEQNEDENLDTHPENCFHQERVRKAYETQFVQISVALLIFFNFCVSALQAQMLPEEGTLEDKVFFVLEYFFNISFAIELVWNLYGSWFLYFWQSGWNWFDFIIVVVSLLSMSFSNLPGISVLRLLRAFRVFRLFKRVDSLKKIIEGVFGSLPGVSQAFMVLGILMGIWSVIGVEFFAGPEPQFFGNFSKAMFTMWQIMTMDSWSSGIARNIIFKHDYPLAAIFFISYIFIAGIVMTNVVVAILLDKYLEAMDKDKEPQEDELDELDPAETEKAKGEGGDVDSQAEAVEMSPITKEKTISRRTSLRQIPNEDDFNRLIQEIRREKKRRSKRDKNKRHRKTSGTTAGTISSIIPSTGTL